MVEAVIAYYKSLVDEQLLTEDEVDDAVLALLPVVADQYVIIKQVRGLELKFMIKMHLDQIIVPRHRHALTVRHRHRRREDYLAWRRSSLVT